MDMNEAVAKALNSERTIAELTVRKLAELSRIPERSLMRILQAERDIKVNQVEMIAEALKLFPHEIIERAEIIMERANREAPDMANVTVGRFGNNDEPELSAVADTTEESGEDEDRI